LNTGRQRPYTGDDMILDYLKPTNYLSVEEERELLKLCKQNNDSAKEKLVLSNIRFIYSEAKKINSQKVSIDDLVVAGIQGLLEAIPKFDMSSNNRFMTFASFWIRKELFDYIYQNSSQLKVSTPKVTLAIKLRKKICRTFFNERQFKCFI
jgi:RNA polymerase primary sigma factor